MKILSDLPVAFAEGDNAIVVAYYKDDDEQQKSLESMLWMTGC